jgi:hypothetical protein
LWIVVAWAVLCIGIGLVGFGTLRRTKHQIADEAAANADRAARLLLASFERTSDSVDRLLKTFATGFSPQSTPSELIERLRSLNLPSAIVQLTVVSPDGRALVNNLTPEPERVDVSDWMHICAHHENRVDGLYISPLF